MRFSSRAVAVVAAAGAALAITTVSAAAADVPESSSHVTTTKADLTYCLYKATSQALKVHSAPAKAASVLYTIPLGANVTATKNLYHDPVSGLDFRKGSSGGHGTGYIAAIHLSGGTTCFN
jgi:hypothetical protein